MNIAPPERMAVSISSENGNGPRSAQRHQVFNRKDGLQRLTRCSGGIRHTRIAKKFRLRVESISRSCQHPFSQD